MRGRMGLDKADEYTFGEVLEFLSNVSASMCVLWYIYYISVIFCDGWIVKYWFIVVKQ